MTQRNAALEIAEIVNQAFAETGGAQAAFATNRQLLETMDRIRAGAETFHERGGIHYHISDDPVETAKRYNEIQIKQNREEGARPPLPLVVDHHVGVLGMDRDSPEYKAAVMIAARAEMEIQARPQYHDKNHYTDVATITGNLIAKNDEMVRTGAGGVELTAKDKMIMLMTATGHDVDHEGKGNPKDDPTLNERKSFDVMKPIMKAAGMSASDIERARIIQICTSPNGPNKVLEEVERAQKAGVKPDFSKADPEGRFVDVSHALVHDPKLVQMAGMVAASDLAASFGMDRAANIDMTKRLSDEIGMNLNSAGAQKFAHDNIVGAHFPSDAGRAAFDGNYQKLRQAAIDDLAAQAAAKAAMEAAPPTVRMTDSVRSKFVAPPGEEPPTLRTPSLNAPEDSGPDTVRAPDPGAQTVRGSSLKAVAPPKPPAIQPDVMISLRDRAPPKPTVPMTPVVPVKSSFVGEKIKPAPVIAVGPKTGGGLAGHAPPKPPSPKM